MKPFSTGSEMKPARNPSRRPPAISAATPDTSARTTVSCANSFDRGPATSATVAAESAAVAAIGPVTRCFELPSAA